MSTTTESVTQPLVGASKEGSSKEEEVASFNWEALDEKSRGKIASAADFEAIKAAATLKHADAAAVTTAGHMYSKDSAFSALCCCGGRTTTDTKPFPMAAQIEPNLWRSALRPEGLLSSVPGKEGLTTVAELFDASVKDNSNLPILGTRRVTSWTKEGRKSQTGMAEYEWINYSEMGKQVDKMAQALISFGLVKNDIVTIFSETRFEWQVTAQACWKLGLTVGTAYANLGVEALSFGVNQMEAKVIVCEASNAGIVAEALAGMKTVTHALFFEDQRPESKADGAFISVADCKASFTGKDVTAVAFQEALKIGGTAAIGDGPAPEDTAVIMYTSGSTGNPKGVMLSHANVIATMGAFKCTGLFERGQSHCAVYPLAHIMEICVELGCILMGMKIGFGTTKTMVTGSPFLAAGTIGDLAELEPTFLLGVPLILERLQAKVNAGASKKVGAEKWEAIVARAKQARSEGTKCMKFMDTLVLNKIRAGLLGKNLKLIVSGSAPLSESTEEWASAVLGAPILQGYAMTETTCAATMKWANDFSYLTVGAPVQSVDIKMIDWIEGNYRVHPTDEEKAQEPPIKEGGEILIAGPSVAQGYFKMPEKTATDFVMDKQGRRWFCTGDVGLMDEFGRLKIIDRKKDIKKLAGGEYISYGKIEPVMKSSPLVDNAMVYADSTEKYCVVVVTWPQEELKKAPTEEAVLKSITECCKAAKLQRFEYPKKVFIEPEIQWNADNNLTTTTFKIKRANVQAKYEAVLAQLYGKGASVAK